MTATAPAVKNPGLGLPRHGESQVRWFMQVIPGTGKGIGVQVLLKYILSLRPAWATRDPVPIINEQILSKLVRKGRKGGT